MRQLSVSYDKIDVDGCKHSGMIQSIIGTLSIIFGVACVAIECEQSSIAYPIWGGVWFMTTGFIGCRSVAKLRSGSHVALVAYATLNIFCGVIAFNMLVVTSQAAIEESEDSEASTPETARIALDCVLVFLGSAEVCAAIWGDIVAFCAIRKIRKQRSSLLSQQTTTTYQTMGNTAVITSPFQPHPYGASGYQPPPGYDAPPKYEEVSKSQMPPSYHDNTTAEPPEQQSSDSS